VARSTKESEAAILEAKCQERTSISASLNLLDPFGRSQDLRQMDSLRALVTLASSLLPTGSEMVWHHLGRGS